MVFSETRVRGVWLVAPEPREDFRGFFARTWCAREFAAAGIDDQWVQCSISFTKKRGTLRGLHYQRPPHEEAKLVRCTMGRIHDVIVDLRRQSPTFKQHVAVELSAANRSMIYVPKGCAHGFVTLEDDTEVFYQMSDDHAPDYATGVRWDDPAFGIVWPDRNPIMSDRDRTYPDFE